MLRLIAVMLASIFICSTSAGTIHFTLDYNQLRGNLYVNGTATTLPSGLSIDFFVDQSTLDTWPQTDFGLFPVLAAFMTLPDLGVVNQSITTPLAYFEDDSPNERAGLSFLQPSAAINVMFAPPGQSEIGDPNKVDTLPTMLGDPSLSVWSGQFRVELSNGIIVDSNNTWVYADQSSLASSLVSEPPLVLLFAIGIGLILMRKRRKLLVPPP